VLEAAAFQAADAFFEQRQALFLRGQPVLMRAKPARKGCAGALSSGRQAARARRFAGVA